MTVTPSISAQEVLSCSRQNQACDGGFPYLVTKHGFEQGFVDANDAPYTGTSVSCPSTLSSAQRYYLTSDYGYVGGYYGACNEALMMSELHANGPIVVAFWVTDSLYYYSGGIFAQECPVQEEAEDSDVVNAWENTNHAVTLVGWGVDGDQKYWIVQNSWGSDWGEVGYFRIARGIDECAIESMASYGHPSVA